jgi:hypothetical protein
MTRDELIEKRAQAICGYQPHASAALSVVAMWLRERAESTEDDYARGELLSVVAFLEDEI